MAVCGSDDQQSMYFEVVVTSRLPAQKYQHRLLHFISINNLAQ